MGAALKHLKVKALLLLSLKRKVKWQILAHLERMKCGLGKCN